jgi:hypothetical protein
LKRQDVLDKTLRRFVQNAKAFLKEALRILYVADY